MELLLHLSRSAASSLPSPHPLLPTTPRRRPSIARPAASSSNIDVIDTTATAVKNRPERHGGPLGLNLSEEMRRGMLWRMLAPPAAAVAAETAFLRLLDHTAGEGAPAWAGVAGSSVIFAAGLLGFHYGFLSSRWDAAERGSLVGWELAVQHWNALSMAKDSSLEEEEEEEEEVVVVVVDSD